MLVCKLKLLEEMMIIFKVFFGSVMKLKLQFAKKDKITVGNKMIAGVKVAIAKKI